MSLISSLQDLVSQFLGYTCKNICFHEWGKICCYCLMLSTDLNVVQRSITCTCTWLLSKFFNPNEYLSNETNNSLDKHLNFPTNWLLYRVWIRFWMALKCVWRGNSWVWVSLWNYFGVKTTLILYTYNQEQSILGMIWWNESIFLIFLQVQRRYDRLQQKRIVQ